jgi:hypothetical protein
MYLMNCSRLTRSTERESEIDEQHPEILIGPRRSGVVDKGEGTADRSRFHIRTSMSSAAERAGASSAKARPPLASAAAGERPAVCGFHGQGPTDLAAGASCSLSPSRPHGRARGASSPKVGKLNGTAPR